MNRVFGCISVPYAVATLRLGRAAPALVEFASVLRTATPRGLFVASTDWVGSCCYYYREAT
jgi:hypothetical protein